MKKALLALALGVFLAGVSAPGGASAATAIAISGENGDCAGWDGDWGCSSPGWGSCGGGCGYGGWGGLGW